MIQLTLDPKASTFKITDGKTQLSSHLPLQVNLTTAKISHCFSNRLNQTLSILTEANTEFEFGWWNLNLPNP